MGNITGAMVFQSTIPTVVALLFAADAWHFSDGSRIAFPSAGIAFLVVGRDLHPDGPVAAGCSAGGCSSAASSTSSTSRSCWRVARRGRLGSRRRRRPPGPPGRAILGRPSDDRRARRPGAAGPAQERPHADPEVEPGRGAAPPAPAADPHAAAAPRDLDEPHLLLRGRVRPAARREGQHHDPRVHVRDGDVRGHPGLLERRAGQALRAEAPRARRADPPVVPDPPDEGRAVRRRARRPDRRDRPPERLPRGRLHPAVVLQVDRRRSASGSTTSRTSSTSSRSRSGTTSTPRRASGS